MNRFPSLACRAALAALILFSGASRVHAQGSTPPPTAQQSAPDAAKAPAPGAEDSNPFAPSPAPPLPAGMTGSDVNDPRYKLTPGLYDAGETSMGLKHLQLLKKPDAFQLGTTDPDDPKVAKTLQQLGSGGGMKIPKPLQIVIAELAFSNSDLAFEGDHLFQGNFYGMNIYDISKPAHTALLTSMICPGGQGDVSVYKNLMFMSVEMPNGRLDCGVQGFPPEPPPPADENKDKDKEGKDKISADHKDDANANDKDKDKDKDKDEKEKDKKKKRSIPVAQKDRFRGVRIFDISDIKN